jgi:uncharacterized protein (TIGR00255 family)
VRAVAKEYIRRGKAEFSFSVENITESDARIRLNTAAAEQYVSNLRELKRRFDIEGDIDLNSLAGMPDVMKQTPEIEDEEEIRAAFESAARRALSQFDAMRLVEGGKLSEDVRARAASVAAYAGDIKRIAPDIARAYSEKLRERISELLGGEIEIPEERIALEAAIFADKSDITEELVRLQSHLAQLKSILSEECSANGKKLDFLVQEINRETNTIGAKANNVRITNCVLEMKSETEKIREQIQNIE